MRSIWQTISENRSGGHGGVTELVGYLADGAARTLADRRLRQDGRVVITIHKQNPLQRSCRGFCFWSLAMTYNKRRACSPPSVGGAHACLRHFSAVHLR